MAASLTAEQLLLLVILSYSGCVHCKTVVMHGNNQIYWSVAGIPGIISEEAPKLLIQLGLIKAASATRLAGIRYRITRLGREVMSRIAGGY